VMIETQSEIMAKMAYGSICWKSFVELCTWPMQIFMSHPAEQRNRAPSNYDLMLNRRIDGLEKIILHNPLEICQNCGKLIPSGECKND